MTDGAVIAEHKQLLEGIPQSAVGGGCAVAPLGPNGDSGACADSATGSLLLDARGRRVAVLFLSNAAHPESVACSVRKAAEAKMHLGESLGGVVLVPLAQGN
jgi:hypothetical protein